MDSSIPVRTLAVKDCCGKHTSDQIKTLIQEVLTQFEILIDYEKLMEDETYHMRCVALTLQ